MDRQTPRKPDEPDETPLALVPFYRQTDLGSVLDAHFEDLWLCQVGPTVVALLRMTHRMFDEAAWPMDGLHTTWGDLAVSLGVGVPMLRRTFTRMLQFAWFASEAPGGYGLRMTHPAPPRAAGRSRLVLDRITPGAVTA